VGCILTGIFASSSIIATDGVSTYKGGWIDQNWNLLGIQVTGAIVGSLYSFFMTYLLAFIFSKIPFLNLRMSEEDELA